MNGQLTLAALLQEGRRTLQDAGIEEWAADAWYLFEDARDVDRVHMLTYGREEAAGREKADQYRDMLCRRLAGEPVQYITGKAWFMGLPFQVNPAVLIPRQDTEVLVEKALEFLRDGQKILDLCTGSGCIILSLAAAAREKQTARINAEALQLPQVSFVESDMFEMLDGDYDMIVSNPPYIPAGVVDGLDPKVRCHEPRGALDGGEDGLDFYRIIAGEAFGRLRAGGCLALEIGFDQAGDVTGLLAGAGFHDVSCIKDLAGLERVVFGRR